MRQPEGFVFVMKLSSDPNLDFQLSITLFSNKGHSKET